MNYQIVEVKRGGQGYLIENHLFRKERDRDGTIYLKCLEAKREFCPARARICDGEATVTNENHNHALPDIVDYKFRASLKAEVKRMGNARTSVPQVYESVRNEVLADTAPAQRNETANRLTSFRTLRGCMEHARSSLLPPNPATRAEIDFADFQDQLRNEDGSSFLIADSGAGDEHRILIFGNNRNLQSLSQSREWFMDGTFWVVPFIFMQLFTIHAFILGQQFPLIYALLPNKCRNTYERMFHMLMQQVINRGYYAMFALETVISDFESGLIAALRAIFPHVVHRGCYFHYAQAINRKISEIGFAAR